MTSASTSNKPLEAFPLGMHNALQALQAEPVGNHVILAEGSLKEIETYQRVFGKFLQAARWTIRYQVLLSHFTPRMRIDKHPQEALYRLCLTATPKVNMDPIKNVL